MVAISYETFVRWSSLSYLIRKICCMIESSPEPMIKILKTCSQVIVHKNACLCRDLNIQPFATYICGYQLSHATSLDIMFVCNNIFMSIFQQEVLSNIKYFSEKNCRDLNPGLLWTFHQFCSLTKR
jgi:hypothetical protein